MKAHTIVLAALLTSCGSTGDSADRRGRHTDVPTPSGTLTNADGLWTADAVVQQDRVQGLPLPGLRFDPQRDFALRIANGELLGYRNNGINYLADEGTARAAGTRASYELDYHDTGVEAQSVYYQVGYSRPGETVDIELCLVPDLNGSLRGILNTWQERGGELIGFSSYLLVMSK